MKFSERIMELRKSKGMSQEELAGKLNVTRQTISKWESAQTVPDLNRLIDIAKLFGISLDELTNNIENSNSENVYKESSIEKNNRQISIKIFVVGIIICLILCGIGLIKQNVAKNTNQERAQQALEQSQQAVDNANNRLKEIEEEQNALNEQYENKKKEADSLNQRDSNWYANYSQLQREASNLHSQITNLSAEKLRIQNTDYTVYYQLVDPITYCIYYYIGAGIFVVMSLIALIYFLLTRKKK